ncbi:MAG: hypothetical protein JNL98_03755 [Bryobacterales bacterium]|nr:hypothetical protein [Bryobacterales bacterium]
MKYLLFLLIAASLNAQVTLEGPWQMTRQDSPVLALPETAGGDWAEVQLPWKERPASGIFWLRRTVTLDAGLAEAALVVGRPALKSTSMANGSGPFLVLAAGLSKSGGFVVSSAPRSPCGTGHRCLALLGDQGLVGGCV